MTPRENGPKTIHPPQGKNKCPEDAERMPSAKEEKSVRSRDGGWGEKHSCLHCLLAAATLLIPCLGEGVEERGAADGAERGGENKGG
jgi:hypothetical protein